MYCYIKYSEEINEGTSINKAASNISTAGVTTSLTKGLTAHKLVKYEKEDNDKNKVIMVNPDCYIQILLDYIYEILKLNKLTNKIDLCTEKGELLKVSKLNPYDSALELLVYKETYIVVIYEVDSAGNYTKLEPLLSLVTKQDCELNHKIMKNLRIKKSSMNIANLRGSSLKSEVKHRAQSQTASRK